MFEHDPVVGYFLLGFGAEILYVGITNDPDAREYEHRRDIGFFAELRVVTDWMPRSAARKWEAAKLRQVGRTRYNRTPWG